MGEEKKNSIGSIIFQFVIFMFIIVWTVGNIYYSQTVVDPLYYSFTTENTKSAITFLKRARGLADYSKIFASQQQIYGEELQNAVVIEQIERSKIIYSMEKKLLQQPKSPQVLYALSLLYADSDNNEKAKEYKDRALELDPDIIITHQFSGREN
ncbi:MAG: hypothetical protein WCO06_04985 [Candidatus Roizmanbacteria bacterium]